jgi:CBS domain-containing protein
VLTRSELIGETPPDTRVRDLLGGPAIVIYDDCSLREAADRMAQRRIGRLPVVTRAAPRAVIGILTRSDLIDAHVHRLEDQRKERVRSLRLQ